jgi:hypothetical protein
MLQQNFFFCHPPGEYLRAESAGVVKIKHLRFYAYYRSKLLFSHAR